MKSRSLFLSLLVFLMATAAHAAAPASAQTAAFYQVQVMRGSHQVLSAVMGVPVDQKVPLFVTENRAYIAKAVEEKCSGASASHQEKKSTAQQEKQCIPGKTVRKFYPKMLKTGLSLVLHRSSKDPDLLSFSFQNQRFLKFSSIEKNGAKIQLPNVDTVAFKSKIRLRPGQKLTFTGEGSTIEKESFTIKRTR